MHIVFVDANLLGLEAIRRAKEAGHRVSFLQSPAPMYARSPHNLRILASIDRIEDVATTMEVEPVRAALAACGQKHPIDFVTMTQELCVEPVALACRALGLACTDSDGLLTARRKDLCRRALDRAGVPSARYAAVGGIAEAIAAADEIGYPVVIKPPSGSDSLLAFTAYDAADARAAAERVVGGLDAVPPLWRPQFRRGILVEEMLVGTLVSVEIGVRGGEFHPFCVSGRNRWSADQTVELGAFIPANLDAQQTTSCVEYAKDVCRAIGLDLGVFHLELMYTERGPVLIEANPRIMGGGLPLIYRHATGQDIFISFVQLITGAAVDTPGTIDGCTGGRKVMMREDGRIADPVDLGWLEEHSDAVIQFDNYAIEPGLPVRRGDIVGRVVVRAHDHAEMLRRAEEILRRFEHALGLPLMIGEYDAVVSQGVA